MDTYVVRGDITLDNDSVEYVARVYATSHEDAINRVTVDVGAYTLLNITVELESVLGYEEVY